MRKTIAGLGFALLFILGTAAVSLAGKVDIFITPPPPPVVVAPPPPVVVTPVPPPPVVVAPAPAPVVVFPPLPPGIVIAPGPPVYWFWDDGRAGWFYYDVRHRRHFVRRHVYVDDGRHFYREGRDWRVGHEDQGRHRGWYKHGRGREKEWKHEGRGHGKGRGRGHDRD